MLKTILTRHSQSKKLHRTVKHFFAGPSHGFKPGSKAPTLATSTIPMNIETFEGQIQRILVKVGEPLWNELKKNGVNIGGFCGGGEQDSMRDSRVALYTYGNMCASCYCAIDEPWYSNLGEIHECELEALADINESYPANTRFACSLTVEGWMDEMVIRVLTNRNDEGKMNQDFTSFS